MTANQSFRPFVYIFLLLSSSLLLTSAFSRPRIAYSASNIDINNMRWDMADDYHPWDYGQWIELGEGSASGGGISNNGGYSTEQSLAISPIGVPIVAWADYQGDDEEIYVRRWNGSAWAEMGANSASGGGISNNKGHSDLPSLAIGPNGFPSVAWEDESSGTNQIYFRRWNGSAWVEMGANSATGGGISNNGGHSEAPSLAIGADGIPIIAWKDSTEKDDEIFVRRWDGSAWAEMGQGSASSGGISDNEDNSFYPSLAITPDGNPIVAWTDYSSGVPQIYVRRWDGAAWAEMGQGSASDGGISNSFNLSAGASIVIDPNGAPVITWVEIDDWHKVAIYALRWNGSAWVEMVQSSASGGGILGWINNSSGYSLAIGPDGIPLISWGENDQILVRRWNGSSWVEMGVGSASGGGISNTEGRFSQIPSAAIGPDGAPIIAWNYFSIQNDFGEIYLRRWQTHPYVVFLPAILSKTLN